MTLQNNQITETEKIAAMLDYTNKRLASWYVNAKLDYDVDGEGVATFEDGYVKFVYTENKVTKEYSVYYGEHSLIRGPFDVWSSEAL